jgi:prepilin-type N-terminal cleavage/methylation domain-containing protein
MRARLRQLRSEESGFTLPELITAMAIGMVVLLAAFMLLDRAVAGSTKLSDRQEAVQRGRLAMELVSRQLRSQVCLGEAQPILAGTDDSVTFYANLSSSPNSAEKRTLRYVASEKRLYEDVYTGSGTFPSLSFPSTPTRSQELLRPVVPTQEKVGSTMVARPIFRYYKYATGTTTGALQQLTTPLSGLDAPEVIMVNVAFATLPVRLVERTTDVLDATTFESNVYVRLADPAKPTEGPTCL